LNRLRQVRKSSDLRLIIPIAIAASLLAGCSSSVTSVPPVDLKAVAVATTSGPKICHRMATSLALRQLPAAMGRLEVPSEWTAGRQVVTSAAVELRGLTSEAPQQLAYALDGAARALSPLARIMPDEASIGRAVSSLETLATVSQDLCSFGST
jgi:hypothetical protein